MLTVYNFMEDFDHLTKAVSHIIDKKVEDVEQIDLVAYFLQRTAIRFFTLGAMPNSASAWKSFRKLQKYKKMLLKPLNDLADTKELPKGVPVVRFSSKVTEYLIQRVTSPHTVVKLELSVADKVRLHNVNRKVSNTSKVVKRQKELDNILAMTAPNKKALEYAKKLNIRFG